MATNPNDTNWAYNAQASYQAQLAHEAVVYEARALHKAQQLEAQAAYEAQAHEAQAYYEAQQPMIIHTTAHWFWQCHLCGHCNTLHNEARDFWRAFPSVLQMQSACTNPSDSMTRSNHTNSESRVHPNNSICGHDRCNWCFDLDENTVPIRFSSGEAVTREQYENFWGWRFWAERRGLPSGDVSWEEYGAFCVRWFGGVPTLMPPPPPLGLLEEEEDDESAGLGRGQDVGQSAGQAPEGQGM